MKPLVILGLLVLAACGGKPAPERYSLIASAPVGASCRSEVTVKFRTPNAAPGLDTSRIVVMDRPNHLTHYQGVAWGATTARQVQHFLADHLEQTGMVSAVSTDLDTLPADYEIDMELREFHVDLTGEPRVRVRLTATVTRADGARMMKRLILRREAPVGGANMEGIVAIFNEQMHSIAQELESRLGRTIPGCPQ